MTTNSSVQTKIYLKEFAKKDNYDNPLCDDYKSAHDADMIVVIDGTQCQVVKNRYGENGIIQNDNQSEKKLQTIFAHSGVFSMFGAIIYIVMGIWKIPFSGNILETSLFLLIVSLFFSHIVKKY